ncbi:MAG: Trm112 family protein [Planctomycetota bacterium]|jgi:hypothetical protein|nr:Trm112 family protein [Planctomycetota bacterium]
MIQPELLEILACPACKTSIRLEGEEWLVCDACQRQYPIRDGIPVLLVEEARRPGDAQSDSDTTPAS